jgi:hypothetical protein
LLVGPTQSERVMLGLRARVAHVLKKR